jgi:hypothetical protein
MSPEKSEKKIEKFGLLIFIQNEFPTRSWGDV